MGKGAEGLVLARAAAPAPAYSDGPYAGADTARSTRAIKFGDRPPKGTVSPRFLDNAGRRIATGPLAEFPWERMGNYKYLLFAPFAARVLLGYDDADRWALHTLLIAGLRYAMAFAWHFAARCEAVSGRTRINLKGVGFAQVDREGNWDDYIILQALVVQLFHSFCPGFHSFPAWHPTGLLQMALLHVGPTEFVYYWFHRYLHHHTLYQRYHSHHHASFVAEPITGSCHPFLEHVGYTANFAIPLLGTWALGGASVAMFYIYLLGFDFLNELGHANFELPWLSAALDAIPFARYLIYTPAFHSLHHSRVNTNYALFMPIYDHLYGTADPTSTQLSRECSAGREYAPGAVFLAHGVDATSVVHLPFMSRDFSSNPYPGDNALRLLLWPVTFPLMLAMWALAPLHPFVAERKQILNRWHKEAASPAPGGPYLQLQTWVVPRLGWHYFLPFEFNRINTIIRNAVLRAEREGHRVIGLGALNKNEQLNGGGKAIVEALEADRDGKPLGLSVVHGNTLTAACVIRSLPQGTDEVVLTGATSKLGRAIALHLCQRGVRVLMVSKSDKRVAAIVAEAPADAQRLLEHVTDVSDARCASVQQWVVGSWLGKAQQQCAPAGAHFHQFVVPALQPLRKDCTYGTLVSMRLPEDAVRGLRACEMTMERGVVHACHAGAIVHALEGWTHHEVGSIDVTRIDTVWDAARKHGFSLAS